VERTARDRCQVHLERNVLAVEHARTFAELLSHRDHEPQLFFDLPPKRHGSALTGLHLSPRKFPLAGEALGRATLGNEATTRVHDGRSDDDDTFHRPVFTTLPQL